jgi:hypothetical protein
MTQPHSSLATGFVPQAKEMQNLKRANFLRARYAGGVFALVCCALALGLSSCAMKKRQHIPWAIAIQARPNSPAHNSEAGAGSDAALPIFATELPSFPGTLVLPRMSPPRPRVITPSTGAGTVEPEKTGSPSFTPQLSAQESAADRREMQDSLTIAEKNLAIARNRKLNPAQADLLSKIRSYIKDAREAAQGNDWGHARSSAKKAQVLSEELVGSL